MTIPLLTEIQQPSEFVTAILTHLATQLTLPEGTELLLDKYSNFAPAAGRERNLLLEVTAAEAGDRQNDGRIAQLYHCTLHVAIRDDQPDATDIALDMASETAQQLLDNCWGWTQRAVECPLDIRLAEAFPLGGGEQQPSYHTWTIDWQQQLNLGSPQYEEDHMVDAIWLAVNPQNSEDISEYREVEEQCLNELWN